ncbi:MAG TPA: hypothetical protein VNO55_31750 [Polyangia bacterium]|nr:hypothetical protein [Polyangia bacterium]
MQIVPAVTTPITAEQARVLLVAAMPGIDRNTGTLLHALVWLETARGQLQNGNAGNITASDKWGGSAWRPPWYTVDASSPAHMLELHAQMLKGKAPSAFRAYGSALEGFQDFARVLRAQFAPVLTAAATGDAGAFVHALHDTGYSDGYTQAVVPHMTSLQHELAPLWQSFPPPAGGAGAGAFAFLKEVGVEVAVAIVATVVLSHINKPKPKRRRRRLAAERH